MPKFKVVFDACVTYTVEVEAANADAACDAAEALKVKDGIHSFTRNEYEPEIGDVYEVGVRQIVI